MNPRSGAAVRPITRGNRVDRHPDENPKSIMKVIGDGDVVIKFSVKVLLRRHR